MAGRKVRPLPRSIRYNAAGPQVSTLGTDRDVFPERARSVFDRRKQESGKVPVDEMTTTDERFVAFIEDREVLRQFRWPRLKEWLNALPLYTQLVIPERPH